MRVDKITTRINNQDLLLRNPEEDDAEILLESFKLICGETLFLSEDPRDITLTLEDEIDFIKNLNDSERDVMLMGFLDGEYVGNCSLMGKATLRHRHRTTLGIALFQRFTGMGIGSVMIEELISLAKENDLEQVELEVNGDNTKAISLYEKMGFEIMGTFPNYTKYEDGSYADTHWMAKRL